MELYKIIVIVGCFLPGIIFLTVSIIGFRRDNYIKTRGIPVQAEVVEIMRNGKNYRPVVEYRTSEGIIRVKSLYSGSGVFFNFKAGDKVNIFYDENKPKSFRFENDKIGMFLWGLFFFLGIMGLIMSCFIPFVLV
ncbi:DUF3592 domain-containing protein [Sebaldella sp. S0638]|uniref:DUF3592 domain-containing protein n=1 Tax=Sebaldella sp. S0638 TaxID=2957809 RepID=UPI00209C8EAE|nr:DUF3592 domain-containing protein [Sebaldella sp. S0638]MCP1223557.1 DUF3592 domain-containing protein [Sebaldella sp. S0638]